MEEKLLNLRRDLDKRVYKNMKLTKDLETKIIKEITNKEHYVGKSTKLKNLLSVAVLLIMISAGINLSVTYSGNGGNDIYLSTPFLNKAEQMAKNKKLTSELLRFQQNEDSLTMEMMIKDQEDLKQAKQDVKEVLLIFSSLYHELHPTRKDLWKQKNVTVYVSGYNKYPPPYIIPSEYILVGYKSHNSKNLKWETNFQDDMNSSNVNLEYGDSYE